MNSTGIFTKPFCHSINTIEVRNGSMDTTYITQIQHPCLIHIVYELFSFICLNTKHFPISPFKIDTSYSGTLMQTFQHYNTLTLGNSIFVKYNPAAVLCTFLKLHTLTESWFFFKKNSLIIIYQYFFTNNSLQINP